MIELTEEMRTRIGQALADGYPVVAASVDGRGQPKLSFYGTTQVFAADQLAIWVRDPGAGLLGRIVTNPRMAFQYRNPVEKVAWQFHGRARVEPDEAVRRHVYDASPEIERSLDPDRHGVAVLIDLDLVTGRGLVMERESAGEAASPREDSARPSG